MSQKSSPVALLAVANTLASERLNLYLASWAYSPAMPVLPRVRVGLAPLLQRVLVPPVAVWWATRQHRNRSGEQRW